MQVRAMQCRYCSRRHARRTLLLQPPPASVCGASGRREAGGGRGVQGRRAACKARRAAGGLFLIPLPRRLFPDTESPEPNIPASPRHHPGRGASLSSHLLKSVLLRLAARLLLHLHKVRLALTAHSLVLEGQVLHGRGQGSIGKRGSGRASRAAREPLGGRERRWGRERHWGAPDGHPLAAPERRRRMQQNAAARCPPPAAATAIAVATPHCRTPLARSMPTWAAWRPEPTTASSCGCSFISTSPASTGSFLAFLASLAAGLSPASRLAPAFLPAGGAGRGGRERRWAGDAGAAAAGGHCWGLCRWRRAIDCGPWSLPQAGLGGRAAAGATPAQARQPPCCLTCHRRLQRASRTHFDVGTCRAAAAGRGRG